MWWRELDLPTRSIVTRTGRITESPPPGVPDGEAWRAIAGRTVKQAQRAMVELLAASGDLVGEPRPITHPVKFYERGDRPLEIVTSRQWFIRNGGRDDALRRGLLAAGHRARLAPALHAGPLRGLGQRAQRRLAGQPAALLRRARSRSGTRSAPTASPTTTRPSSPTRPACPSTPRPTCPTATRPSSAARPGGFVGDPDVMDTWATSSLTPQIACGWEDDPDLFAATFPMDLRPQGHEIIRTWLFSTVLRSHLEHDVVPWQHTTINGWILDPDRKKMSKSKGNVVTPMPLLEEFGSDAVRYWACNGRPGHRHRVRHGRHEDRPPPGHQDPQRVEVRARAASATGPVPGVDAVREPLDLALLAQLADVVDRGNGRRTRSSTTPGRSSVTETFFWSFCDDYVELVKTRAYGEGDAGRHRLGPGHPGPRPLGPAPALRPLPPLRHRGGVELVAGGLGPPRRPGPSVAEVGAARRRRPGRARRGGRGARRGAPREDGPQALHAGAGGAPPR